MFQRSESINELAGALAKAQAKFKPLKKDKTVDVASTKGSYKYNYADLASLIESVREALSENGLSFIQPITESESGGVLLTVLMHSSGQWIESQYALPDDGTAQQYGSAITYGRRYSLSSILGIASEEDDDGAKASDVARKPSRNAFAKPDHTQATTRPPIVLPAQSSQGQAPTMSEAERKMAKLKEIRERRNWTAEQVKEYMSLKYKTDKFSFLSDDQFFELCRAIEIMTANTAIKTVNAPPKGRANGFMDKVEDNASMFDEPGMNG